MSDASTAGAALRILADDLTGALDTAAQFAGAAGPVAVLFREGDAQGGNRDGAALALSSNTRDAGEADAERTAAGLGRFFDGATLAFRKLDSLLRGHPALEIERAWSLGGFASAVIAPAFPAQGRATRNGIQSARDLAGRWHAVGPDLVQALAQRGVEMVRVPRGGTPSGKGVFLCDADTDADLRAIAAAGKRLARPVLWCGSAGLAAALAGRPVPRLPVPPAPLLAIVGSHHAVARAQVQAVRDARADWVVAVRDPIEAGAALNASLSAHGRALAIFALPEGTAPPDAATRIASDLARLLPALEPPASAFAAGGETLLAIAHALGAERFEVEGELAPGLPRSRMRKGRWDGVPFVSKSGAFGDAGLLLEVLERAGRPLPGTPL